MWMALWLRVRLRTVILWIALALSVMFEIVAPLTIQSQMGTLLVVMLGIAAVQSVMSKMMSPQTTVLRMWAELIVKLRIVQFVLLGIASP